MTRTLQELRDLIDATDKELLALLNRRAGFAAEVGEIKNSMAHRFTDPSAKRKSSMVCSKLIWAP